MKLMGSKPMSIHTQYLIQLDQIAFQFLLKIKKKRIHLSIQLLKLNFITMPKVLILDLKIMLKIVQLINLNHLLKLLSTYQTKKATLFLLKVQGLNPWLNLDRWKRWTIISDIPRQTYPLLNHRPPNPSLNHPTLSMIEIQKIQMKVNQSKKPTEQPPSANGGLNQLPIVQ